MNRLLLIIFLVILGQSCSTTKNGAEAAKLNGPWELVMFPGSSKPFAELFNQRIPELVFDDSARHVSGNTGCNHLSGKYTINGNEIKFGPEIITTKMACIEYDESLFLNALQDVNHYRFREGQLHLLRDTTMLMVFAPRNQN